MNENYAITINESFSSSMKTDNELFDKFQPSRGKRCNDLEKNRLTFFVYVVVVGVGVQNNNHHSHHPRH